MWYVQTGLRHKADFSENILPFLFFSLQSQRCPAFASIVAIISSLLRNDPRMGFLILAVRKSKTREEIQV